MDLIKGKQKDIILLLKDQFFFLIRMMINKWRIWFLNSLVWVRQLPLRSCSTPIKEGFDCRRRQRSLIHTHHGTKRCTLCPIERTQYSALTHAKSSHKCYTGRWSERTLWNVWGFRQGRYELKKQSILFFSYSLNFLLSPGRETWYRKGSGGTVDHSHSSHTILVMS